MRARVCVLALVVIVLAAWSGGGCGALAEDASATRRRTGLENGPVTIALTRNVNGPRRTAALLNLKLRQMSIREPALLEAGDVPLTEEVLSRKHLATYFGEIKIKNGDGHYTTFKALFDTGSCEFWVPSNQCTSQRCQAHDRFPISGHELKMQHGLNIQYLSGKVTGDMIKTEVVLGDLAVQRQAVGLGNVVEIDLLDDVEWDGILGLAYPNPSLSAQGVFPLFDTVIQENILHNNKLSNQFAYYIDDSKGAVTFGGANCDLLHASGDACINAFKFVPVTEQTYWTINIKDVRVRYQGKPERSGFCPAGGCKAIVDTGTYLVYGPAPQVASMMDRSLSGCNIVDLPEISFDFYTHSGSGVETVTLRPIDYVLKFQNDGHDECVMGISPDADTIWTLGQVFLRSFYTVFDRDENRIGFARLPREDFTPLVGLNQQNMHRRHNSGSNYKVKHSFRESKPIVSGAHHHSDTDAPHSTNAGEVHVRQLESHHHSEHKPLPNNHYHSKVIMEDDSTDPEVQADASGDQYSDDLLIEEREVLDGGYHPPRPNWENF